MTDELDMEQFKEIFVQEAKDHLASLNKNLLELEKNPGSRNFLNDIFRSAHTMKGMAATMGFEQITRLAHSMENVLDKLRAGKIEATGATAGLLFDCLDALELLVEEISSGQSKAVDIELLIAKLKEMDNGNKEDKYAAKTNPDGKPAPEIIKSHAPAKVVPLPAKQETEAVPDEAPCQDTAAPAISQDGLITEKRQAQEYDSKSQTVRIKVEHLDKLMNLVGEMVIAKAQLYEISERGKIAGLDSVVNSIGQTSNELQEEVLKTRMVPVKQIFDRFPRMVRDITRKLGKEIDFEMNGTEIEVDRMLLDQINEPLVHLLRNAMDHGIETPSERQKAGKNPAGKVLLSAKREKGFVWIEVADDGKGIDPESIKQKAVEKGIISSESAKSLNENEAFLLICHPGFSMADKITDISGRGVGMDVVKNLVDTFNGKLEIKSKKGKGSTFVVKLPLTLAIIQALVVRLSNEFYCIPLTHVVEIAKIDESYIKTIEKSEVFLLRNEVIPIVRLSNMYNVKQPKESLQDSYAAIVEVNEKKIGIVVDDIAGKQEVVIKTFSGMLKNIKNFSGATIMGDGRVMLIVDVSSASGG